MNKTYGEIPFQSIVSDSITLQLKILFQCFLSIFKRPYLILFEIFQPFNKINYSISIPVSKRQAQLQCQILN